MSFMIYKLCCSKLVKNRSPIESYYNGFRQKVMHFRNCPSMNQVIDCKAFLFNWFHSSILRSSTIFCLT